MNKGRINVYTCKTCGHKTVTIDREDGTTPYIISCDACKNEAYSSFYVCSQGLTPTHEWYKPTGKQLTKLYDGRTLDAMMEYVSMGGLDLREIKQKSSKKPDKNIIEIKANTESANGLWKTPVVEIESEAFIYSSPNDEFHGLQVKDESLEPEIMKLCDEIGMKMKELYKLINK